MSQFDVTNIQSKPATPSIHDRLANFEDRSLPPPGSQTVQDLARELLLQAGGVETDLTDTVEESLVSPNSVPGAAGKMTNSTSFSELSVTSGPFDNGKYN